MLLALRVGGVGRPPWLKDCLGGLNGKLARSESMDGIDHGGQCGVVWCGGAAFSVARLGLMCSACVGGFRTKIDGCCTKAASRNFVSAEREALANRRDLGTR